MFKIILSIFTILLISGCTHVAPYDKADLASTKMLPTPNAVEASFEAHVFGIREGSFGAQNGFSGGCGCK